MSKYDKLRVSYDYTRPNMVIYRLYANTLDYLRMHRSNIRFEEGNKHEMYHFLHFSFACVQVMSCCTRERAKCHIHAHHTSTNVLHTRATHTQTNLSADVIRCNVWVKRKQITLPIL